MSKLPVKGYATFDPLKACVVGRTYDKKQFSHLKNQKVKDTLFRILDETEEDYLNLIKVLEIAGVRVLRPDIVDTDITQRPANQPRDDMAVIGDTLYVNNNKPEYKTIIDSIENKVIVEDCEQQKLVSTSFIHRVGNQLHWGTNQPGWKDSQLVKDYGQRWANEGFNVDIMEHIGHGDCTWCIPKPGMIVTLFEIQNYEEKFPGWDICYIEDKYWDQMSDFRKVKQKNGGKWWVPGEEDNDAFNDYVETYLKDWVGYVEETVFEVNMLSINEETILVNNYNKTVFDFLERHKINPVIVPFRHRWFWDGGVHCVTQDLYREGSLLARY
tara:strand:+ start:4531 stop:5511 length:981 start_codon:yes stop_codon:yes gene_type:complete